jgi:hypothetical protein
MHLSGAQMVNMRWLEKPFSKDEVIDEVEGKQV